MSIKRKVYSADFKAKLVLEVLNGEKLLMKYQVNMKYFP
jgi:transposase-like protein